MRVVLLFTILSISMYGADVELCPLLSAELVLPTTKLNKIISPMIQKGWRIVKKQSCTDSLLSTNKTTIALQVALLQKDGKIIKISYIKKDSKKSKYSINHAKKFIEDKQKSKIFQISKYEIKNRYDLSTFYIDISYLSIPLYELGDIYLNDTEMVVLEYDRDPIISGDFPQIKIKVSKPSINLNTFAEQNLYLVDYYNPSDDIKKLFANKRKEKLRQDIINFVNNSLRKENNKISPEEIKIDKLKKEIQSYN